MSAQSAFPGYSGFMETVAAGDYKPLYNGNISSMVVGVPKLGETRMYNYRYDQLNRIVRMDALQPTRGFYNKLSGYPADLAS